MSGKFLFLTLILATQVSCAEPNYAKYATGGDKNTQADVCAAQFKSGLCVSYEWEKEPTGGAFGSFIFNTFRFDQKTSVVTAENIAATPAVVLWMSTMGHGSSPVTVEQIDVGVYRATNVFFSMRGVWEIRFQSKDGDEVSDQAIIDIAL